MKLPVRQTFAAILLVTAACSDLGDVTRGVCGNHVVEVDEDCDSDADTCGKPGVEGACRYVASDGLCPAGYFAGSDQICRAPSGDFTEQQEAVPELVGSNPKLGDHDGDGELDVAVESLSGAVSTAFYLDRSAVGLGAMTALRGGSSPIFADLTRDGVADFADVVGGVRVTRGARDREPDPKLYPNQTFAGPPLVAWRLVEGSLFADAYAIYRDEASSCGGELCICELGESGCLGPAVALDLPVALDAEQLARTQVASAPGLAILATQRSSTILVARTTIGSGLGPYTAIELPSGASYLGGLVVRDLDGDGWVDVGFIGTLGTGCARWQPLYLKGTEEGIPSTPVLVEVQAALPLNTSAVPCPVDLGGPAFGFILTGDAPTVVTSGTIGVAEGPGTSVSAPWTCHAVGDLNGDGLDDLAAGYVDTTGEDEEAGVEVYLGGADFASKIRFRMSDVVKHIDIVDADGDRFADIVAAVGPPELRGCDAMDELVVAFGRPGFPDAPVRMGRLPGVSGIRTRPAGLGSFDVAVSLECTDVDAVVHRTAAVSVSPARAFYAPLYLDELSRYGLSRIFAGQPSPGSPDAVELVMLGTTDLGVAVVLTLPLQGDAEPSRTPSLVPLAGRSDDELVEPETAWSGGGRHLLGSLVRSASAARSTMRLTSYVDAGEAWAQVSERDLASLETLGCPSGYSACLEGLCVGAACSKEGDPCLGGGSCMTYASGLFCRDYSALCGSESARWSIASQRAADGGDLLAVVVNEVPQTERAEEVTPFTLLALIPWSADGTLGEPLVVPLPAGSTEFVQVAAPIVDGGMQQLLVATDIGLFRVGADGALTLQLNAATDEDVVGLPHRITGLAAGDLTRDGLDDLLVLTDVGGRIFEQIPLGPAGGSP